MMISSYPQAVERLKAELNPPESSKQNEGLAEECGTGEGQDAEDKQTEQSNEGEEAAKEEGAESKETGIKVEYLPLDLSSFQSTIDCVRAFKEKNLPLHILINNAALGSTPYSECCAMDFDLVCRPVNSDDCKNMK